MTRRPNILLPVVAAFALGTNAGAQEPAPGPTTNLRVFQNLAGMIGDSLAAAVAFSDSPSVSVNVAPQDVAWFLQDAVERPFRIKGCRVRVADSARYAVAFGALSMNVTYSDLRRHGIFGSRVVDRTVAIGARTRIEDRMLGTVLAEGERRAQYADTLGISEVEAVEHAAIPATHGRIPSEDFFSGVAEPLVILGAIAAAVFLLFTVRS